MNPDTPIVLAAARYSSREDAVADYHSIKHMKGMGDLDHTDIAVLTKDEDGHLQIERHDSTAKHMAWVGAALVVIAPPVGATALAAGAGAGAIVGHFWRNIPKAKIEEIADLLDAGESGLVIVAVNHSGTDLAPFLGYADQKIVIDTVAGDLDAQIEKELARANATV